MRNFIEKGLTMAYTVGDTSVKSGDLVMAGEVAGVAVTDGAPGETITLNVKGVYELPKGAGAITQGQKVYATVSESGETTVVATATDNAFCGYAWEAAEASAPTVLVRVN